MEIVRKTIMNIELNFMCAMLQDFFFPKVRSLSVQNNKK